MTNPAPELCLLLAGEAAQWQPTRAFRGATQRETPAPRPHWHPYDLRCRLLGYELPLDVDVPVAALERRAQAGGAEGYWLRADAVRLQPVRDHLLLVAGPDQLDGLPADLAARAAALEPERPWRWESAEAGGLHVHFPQAQDLRTTPPQSVLGQRVDHAQPLGADASFWQRLDTELQMMLYDVLANGVLGGDDAPNAVWFWGIGTLPDYRCRWARVAAQAPLLRGLALCGGVQPQQPPADFSAWQVGHPVGGDGLVVLDGAAGDDFERSWLRPAVRALARGRLAALTLVLESAEGQVEYRLSPGGHRLSSVLARWWPPWRR